MNLVPTLEEEEDSMINHCVRRITLLDETDTSLFALFIYFLMNFDDSK